MRRSLLASIFVLLLGLIFTGCRFLVKEPAIAPEQIEQEIKLEKKTGTISLPDQSSLFPDTFLFAGDTNEILNVRSGNINVKKYLKRRVEIEGKKADDGTFEIENIVKLGREDDTREMYRNTKLGFSVQYVSLWTWVERQNEVIFTPYPVSDDEQADRITIAQTSNEKRLAPEKWLDLDQSYVSQDPADTAFYTQVLVGPDQMNGIKRTSKDGTRIDFYIGRDDAMYRLTHATVEDEDEDKYRNIFFEIVNSFQFMAFGNIPSTTVPVVEEIPVPTPEISSATEGEVQQEVAEQPTSSDEPEATEAPAVPPGTEVSAEPSMEGSAESVSDTSPAGLKEGFVSMESRRWGISMQYPKKMYWTWWHDDIEGGDGYAFTDKENAASREDIVFLLTRGNVIPKDSVMSDEGYYTNSSARGSYACKDLPEKGTYCLSGPGTLSDRSPQTYGMINTLTTLQ